MSSASILPEEAKAYIGVQTEFELAGDSVESGAVRRYAQAIMDDDTIYAGGPERHHAPPCSVAAACWTAFTMLT